MLIIVCLCVCVGGGGPARAPFACIIGESINVVDNPSGETVSLIKHGASGLSVQRVCVCVCVCVCVRASGYLHRLNLPYVANSRPSQLPLIASRSAHSKLSDNVSRDPLVPFSNSPPIFSNP